MAVVFANGVQETTSTTGTGTISLAGAVSNFQTFVAGIGSGNEVHYRIAGGGQWEIGTGTVTSGSPDTLSRDTVLESSNSNSLVSFSAGSKIVTGVAPASFYTATDAFISSADEIYRRRNPQYALFVTPGNAENFYPVVFTYQSNPENEAIIRRYVHEDQGVYGAFNGSLFLHWSWSYDNSGSYPDVVMLRAYQERNYSPGIPATSQFVAKISATNTPESSIKPAVWLRGATNYEIALAIGGFELCSGDGVIGGHSYGVLPSSHTPLLAKTTNP